MEQFYDEDTLMELEALKAIFLDDYTEDITTGSFSIRVVPSIAGAFKNFVALQFSARFPSGYPTEPLQEITLKVLEGHAVFPDDTLESVEYDLKRKARSLAGEQMVFSLIEYLKESHLEYFNEDVGSGDLCKLAFEVLMQIFMYLDPRDLAALSLVSRQMNKMALENQLWKHHLTTTAVKGDSINDTLMRKYQSTMKSRIDPTHHDEIPIGFWKQEYLYALSYVPFEPRFVSILMVKNEMMEYWTTYSPSEKIDYIQKQLHLIGGSFRQSQGRILYRSTTDVVGHIRFYDAHHHSQYSSSNTNNSDNATKDKKNKNNNNDHDNTNEQEQYHHRYHVSQLESKPWFARLQSILHTNNNNNNYNKNQRGKRSTTSTTTVRMQKREQSHAPRFDTDELLIGYLLWDSRSLVEQFKKELWRTVRTTTCLAFFSLPRPKSSSSSTADDVLYQYNTGDDHGRIWNWSIQELMS